MCGIVGFVSSKSWGAGSADCKALHNLLLVDTVRGVDGTGLFWQDEDGKMWHWKDAVAAPGNVSKHDVESFIDKARFAVGHNRAATLGGVDKDSTHPFCFDNVTGVHNGTVREWKSLGAKKADMDSKAIYECLDGIDSDEEKVTEFLIKLGHGAYSLVWYDHRINALRFARNSQRPMEMVLTVGGDLWFGSELGMLRWILDRNNIRMKESFTLKTHNLITIPVDGKGAPSSLEYTVPLAPVASTYTTVPYGTSVWDQFDDTYSTTYSKTEAPIGAGPRKINVTAHANIMGQLPSDLSADAQSAIGKSVRNMLGLEPGDVLGKSMDYYLSNFLETSVKGATRNAGILRVPVHLCGFKDDMALGYVEVNGTHVPLVMTAHMEKTVKDRIKFLTDDDHTAYCPSVMVYGLTLYNHADIAYRAGPVVCNVADIERGPKMTGENDSYTIQNFFNEHHPERLAQQGACDWEMWSNLQGGLL